jgi:hypothetical protein
VGVRTLAVLVAICTLGVAACNVNPYHLGGTQHDAGSGGGDDDGGGGGDDGGGGGDGGGSGDGSICMPSVELCNQKDDDCDTKVDEAFHLDQDPSNCGTCGNQCVEPTNTMAGTCTNSACVFTCLPGHINLDLNVAGCEYQCSPTNAGAEACDFADNDCDGKLDEGIDTITSVNNCGGCGRVCMVLNATAACADTDNDGDGDCTYTACNAGYSDVVSMIPGCEYQCPVFPTGSETCNLIDEDCDGRVDEGNLPGVGMQCTDPAYAALGDTGHCSFGTRACTSGSMVCQNYVGPLPDAPGGKENACNLQDDDCDGRTDEGYNLQTDVRNCGTCGHDCTVAGTVPNAIPACVAGGCGYIACLPGYVDLNPAMPGCDYQCTKTGEIDVCDGVDNDCDGDIDDEVTLPGPGFCKSQGACAGGTPSCSFDACANKKRIHCTYGAGVELDAMGCGVASQESRCDNMDNDCDGATDESFPAKHDALACDDGDIGACRRIGVYACNTAGNGVSCDFTSSPPDQLPVTETCNGRDDDCDSRLDEDAPDVTAAVTNSVGAVLYRIYSYEASRPDAASGTIAASPGGAIESGTTATLTTTGAHGLAPGYPVVISGVGVAGYNGTFTVAAVPSTTKFTIVLTVAGLAASGGGSVASVGTMSHRSCSRAGVLPWSSLTQVQAAAACVAAGTNALGQNPKNVHLCTAAEWQQACAGLSNRVYPYGNVYQPNSCNGNDYDPGGMSPDDDLLLLTGSLASCTSSFGALDLSGNVKEWTSTQTSPGVFGIRGGAFDTPAGGLTCQFAFVSGDATFQFSNLGFRCCADP